jgi:adenylyltransferase/sulfurtransferase
VPGSIEIDPQRTAVALSRAVVHEIRRHALEAFPEECCGFVFGTEEERFRRIYRCRNLMNRMHEEDPASFPRTNLDAFYIDPGELLRARSDAAAAGEEVTAIYHSHVGARAYFSEMDLAFATRPGFPLDRADHLVVSILDGQVHELGLFRPDGGGRLAGFRVEEILP